MQVITVPVLSGTLAHAPLSPVMKAGSHVYVSGIPPYCPESGQLVSGDIRTQTRAALRSLQACLAAAGATTSDVVNLRIYCANAAWYTAINEEYRTFFEAPFPTRTFVPVASWPAPFDLEIDCVAYLGSEDEARP